MNKALTYAFLFALPVVASAQTLAPIRTFVTEAGRIIALAIPILIALAMIVFFWGLVKYIWGGGDKETGKSIMIAGLASLFVMVSVWGIILLAGQALNIGQGGSAPLPQVPIP